MHPETTMNTRLLTKLTCVMFTTSKAYNEQRLSSGGVQVFKDREAYSVKLHSILSSFVKSGTIKKCLRSMYYSMSLRISPECYWKWPLWDLKRQQTSHLNCVFVSEFWFTCKLLLRHKTRDQMGSQQPRHPSTRSCSDPWLNRSHYYVFQWALRKWGWTTPILELIIIYGMVMALLQWQIPVQRQTDWHIKYPQLLLCYCCS